MTGVVLCGGQSSRMGSDKGMLKLEARTWAQTAVDKLLQLNIPIVLSVNESQLTTYKTIFPDLLLISDDPVLAIKGPLSGLLSVHLQLPGDDLLVFACDMPLMDVSLFKDLLVQYNEYPGKDAFVYTINGEPEPLCGIYRSNALAAVLKLFQVKELHKHSMKYMLERVETYTIPVSADREKFFRNFNAHAELNGL